MSPPLSESLVVAAALLLGLIAGSFLAAILLRWPRGRSVARGRSECDRCSATLAPRDLVPILSFLVNRGRCRRCGAPIDRRHLALEAGAALIGVAAILAHPMPAAIVTAFFGWWLFLIAAIDAEHHWLPDRLTLPLIPAGLIVGWGGLGPPLYDRLLGAAIGFVALALVAAAYKALRGREGLGGGDPKLLAALGAWLGWPSLPLVLVGAGGVGLAAVAFKALRGGQVRAADRLPFGTLMVLPAWPLWLLIAP